MTSGQRSKCRPLKQGEVKIRKAAVPLKGVFAHVKLPVDFSSQEMRRVFWEHSRVRGRMGKKWTSEMTSQHLYCCQCTMQIGVSCTESGLQRGCSTPAQDKPSNHRIHSWCVNTLLIILNEAAAGLLVGWEPLCQHRRVNGNENVVHLPSSLLFLFPLLPTTQCHCFLALGCWSATQTLSWRRPLSRGERLTKLSDVTASECQGHLKAGRWLGRQAWPWEAKLPPCSGGSTKGIHFLMWSWVNRWVLLWQAPQDLDCSWLCVVEKSLSQWEPSQVPIQAVLSCLTESWVGQT